MADDTKPGTLFSINRSEHAVRLSAQPYVGPRRPAVDGPQFTRCPGVTYRVYSNQWMDDVLITATNDETGWGRMLLISGELWCLLKSRTNPPTGEVALTDDDLETLLRTLHDVNCFRPASENYYDQLEWDDTKERMEEYSDLKEQLFRSDPDVIAHVCKQLDMKVSAEMMVSARFIEGMDLAWRRSGGEGFATVSHHPELEWMVRAAHRASLIVQNRWRK